MKEAKKHLIFWGSIYTVIIFIVSGFIGILTYNWIPEGGPDVYKFLYGGMINFWDTFLALVVGGFLVFKFVKRKK